MQFVLAYKKSRPAKIWTGFALFCLLFSVIYEYFSFGVYSFAMLSIFLYPLLLGVLPCVLMEKDMGRLWNDGVLLLCAGSLLKGILDIYGSGSPYPVCFALLGAVLLSLSLLQEFFSGQKEKNNE